jgi:hypothetical protein
MIIIKEIIPFTTITGSVLIKTDVKLRHLHILTVFHVTFLNINYVTGVH